MATNKKRSKTILVTCATGQQGGASLRHLRERGFSVRALTRNPDQTAARAITGHGVEIVRGDMEDPTSLSQALEGVYGVHSVQDSRPGAESEIRQGINLADAAKRSNVAHFVYSSVASADQQTGIPHFESKFRIEEHIRGTGMHFTVVRPAFFMENFLTMREMIEGGTLGMPLGPTTRLQMVAVEDIGGVVATALEHSGKWRDRVFELAGDELSMAQLAEVFTRACGRDVRYVQIPWDDFEKQAGKETTVMFHWFENVGFQVDISGVMQEYPGLTTFEKLDQFLVAPDGANRGLVMLHQLIITYGARSDQVPFDDEMHVMARMDLGPFEDEGYPETVAGKLLKMPNPLRRRNQPLESIHVDLGGKPYCFTHLSEEGKFELCRDRRAERVTMAAG